MVLWFLFLAQLWLAVPDTRQSTDYSCGAAALQAVLAYYGVEEREDRLIKKLGSDPEAGTPPDAIVRVAGEYGLTSELRHSMTISQLADAVGQGFPVIVCAQAWSEQTGVDWSQDWDDGHYLVVIGVSADQVIFEDPSLLGSRGQISHQQFLQRWHDVEADGSRYLQAGIIVRGRPQPPRALVPID